jgi:hypothetical protein
MKKILLFLALMFILIGCGDDDNSTKPSENRIISFAPQSGGVGNVVEIVVEGFSTNKSELELKFNGTLAKIDTILKSTTVNHLIIKTFVPVGATTGKISITYKGTTYFSSSDFVINVINNEIFPMDNGWFWVYKKYQLDTNSNPITDKYTLDSLVCVGKETILQKEAYKFLSFYTQDNNNQYNQSSNQYYYKDTNKYYAHSSWFNELLNFGAAGLVLPFEITEQWVLIINPNQNDWRIYLRNFNNEQLSFGILNGVLTIDGINRGYVPTTIGTTTFQNVMQVDYKFKFVGNAQTQLGNLPLNLERVMSVYYLPAIGKIKAKMNPMRFIIEGLTDQIIPGFEQQLFRNNITK